MYFVKHLYYEVFDIIHWGTKGTEELVIPKTRKMTDLRCYLGDFRYGGGVLLSMYLDPVQTKLEC